MINVWPYEYCGKVKLVDIDGTMYIGDAQEITDASDRPEDEKQEDGITLNVDGKLIEFCQSEILTIERI